MTAARIITAIEGLPIRGDADPSALAREALGIATARLHQELHGEPVAPRSFIFKKTDPGTTVLADGPGMSEGKCKDYMFSISHTANNAYGLAAARAPERR